MCTVTITVATVGYAVDSRDARAPAVGVYFKRRVVGGGIYRDVAFRAIFNTVFVRDGAHVVFYLRLVHVVPGVPVDVKVGGRHGQQFRQIAGVRLRRSAAVVVGRNRLVPVDGRPVAHRPPVPVRRTSGTT